MIEITEIEHQVLQLYKKLGSTDAVRKRLHVDCQAVSRVMRSLSQKGLATPRTSKPYLLHDLPYEVVSSDNTNVPDGISPADAAWMRKHYHKYKRNRSEAARILGKGRFEINEMAIKLGIGRAYDD